MLLRYTAFLFILGISGTSLGQSYKVLDHADLYKKNEIYSIEKYRVNYANPPRVDTTLIAKCALDEQGRPIAYSTYFAGGRIFQEEFYTYQDDGTVGSIHVKGIHTKGDTIQYELHRDSNGKIRKSVLTLPDGSASLISFDRCSDGFVIAATEQVKRDGTMHTKEVHSFDSKATEDYRAGESTLTYVYDMNGLLIVHNRYNPNGMLREAIHYRYNVDTVVEN